MQFIMQFTETLKKQLSTGSYSPRSPASCIFHPTGRRFAKPKPQTLNRFCISDKPVELAAFPWARELRGIVISIKSIQR